MYPQAIEQLYCPYCHEREDSSFSLLMTHLRNLYSTTASVICFKCGKSFVVHYQACNVTPLSYEPDVKTVPVYRKIQRHNHDNSEEKEPATLAETPPDQG